MRRLPPTVLQRVQQIRVEAPYPYLREGRPAQQFNLLRLETYNRTGVDFLRRVDLLRIRGHFSKKKGVSNRSRHICGDAFDFDVANDRYVIVREPLEEKIYWRVFVKSEKSGIQRTLKCDIQGKVEGRFIDFTELAGEFGFMRIPAFMGWALEGKGSDLREFNHFQLDDNITWHEAVHFLYGRHTERRPMRYAFNERTFGLNDRGKEVKNLQAQLVTLACLGRSEVDGIFGVETQDSIKHFQAAHRLERTGIAEPETRRLISLEVLNIAAAS